MTTPSTPQHPRRGRRAPAVAAALAVLLAGCAQEAGTDPGTDAQGGRISAERCEQNRDAGTITFLTGYQYQASVGILDSIAAQGLGYFDDLCLDVEIQPGTGDTAANAQLTAAGTATLSSLGSEAETLLAAAGGADITAIATYGHVPIATLMTAPEVTDLTQLEGTTLGHKGSLPAPLRAMLVEAGVDVTTIQQVTVGYDPTVLTRGQVQSLTGYKSNEPLALAAAGEEVRQWLPEDYGVVGSFGEVVVNPAFAREHPTAVEDYLRAVLRAYEHCQGAGPECVAFAAELAGADFDTEQNLAVWRAESDLVAASTPDGSPVGYFDPARTEAEGATVVSSGELEAVPEVSALFDPAPLEAVTDGSAVIWPAP